MKALLLRWIPSLMVIVGLIFIASCKDDEKPKARPGFASEESEAFENDGTVDITISLDRAAAETIVLSYSLSGTATKFSAAQGGDYEINPAGGTITIAKGDTDATIEIEVLEDGSFEFDDEEEIAYETVILTLTGIVSGPGQLGEEGLVHTLFIYEDDMIVFLDWDGAGTSDVDMDIFVWYDNPGDSPDAGYTIVNPNAVGGGTTPGNDPEAILLIGGNPDANYGFSYVYYEGTSDDLDFAVTFVNFGGTVNGSTTDVTSNGNYTLANINKYDEPGATSPKLVQTVTKAGLNYSNLSSISIPTSGSRQKIIYGNFGDVNRAELKSDLIAKKITLSPGFLRRFKK